MKNWRIYLSTIAGVLLSATAAYYSVTGIAKLFVSAGSAVIIMAATLEFSKIISAVLIHEYWDKLTKLYKVYFTTAIISLMAITSMGIYGYLTSAYQTTATAHETSLVETNLMEVKKNQYLVTIDEIKEQIEIDRNRITALTEVRGAQENRLDTLYNRGWVSSAKRTEKVIQKANDDIESMNTKIDSENTQISALFDSISVLDITIIEMSNNKATAELGPLLYMSELTGYSMDSVVNILIMVIIFVFDPLALMLLLSSQALFEFKEPEEVGKESDFDWVDTNDIEYEEIQELDEVEETEAEPESNSDDISENNIAHPVYKYKK